MGLSYLPYLQSTPADITQTVARVGLLPLFIIHFDGIRCRAALPLLSYLVIGPPSVTVCLRG